MSTLTREMLTALGNNPDALEKQLTEWRQLLHSHPETAFEEKTASTLVADVLETLGLEVCRGVGGTGVVATLKAGDGNRVIGLRADMDAINLPEQGTVPYRSLNQGKMHGCGHDGHTIMLLGAAISLACRRDFNGTVHFVFQPAEEPGKGAAAMIRDGFLERFPMDEIYGLHNQPMLPFGTISTRVGGINASEDNFEIRIKGRGGHASAPENTIDPLVIASQIILALQTIVSRNANPQDCAVVSCTELHTDGAHNAIPSNVVITGDTRSYSPKMQALIEDRMRTISESICQAHGAECSFTYTHEFAPTINQAACTEKVICASKAVFGADHTFGNCDAAMGSEDFGLFLQHIPGCMLYLGTGEEAHKAETFPLHNACYNFNDHALLCGVRFWEQLVHTCLS